MSYLLRGQFIFRLKIFWTFFFSILKKNHQTIIVACQRQNVLWWILNQLECALFTNYCVTNFKWPKFCWLTSCENFNPKSYTIGTLSLSFTTNPNTTLYCGISFVIHVERLRVKSHVHIKHVIIWIVIKIIRSTIENFNK